MSDGRNPGFHDPRMRGFKTRSTVEDVLALIDGRVGPLSSELVGLAHASGRVLTADVAAVEPLPGFDRAAMDGYAVRGEETHGADAYAPASFVRVGAARPGRAFPRPVQAGEAVEIATGSPMPEGADTVVPVEATRLDGATVLVGEPIPVGRHVGPRGEDLATGALVLRAGRVLRPQDLGVLSGMGVAQVSVRARPRVTILVTGEELLPPGSRADGFRFADMNSPMLAALIGRDGGIPTTFGPLADDRDLIRRAVLGSSRVSDLLLVSGGSSTGPEDHAPGVVAELGELSIHGVALRPASPTGLGFVNGVPVVLLPGNPVSCLCAYDLFAGRAVRRLGGRQPEWPYRSSVVPLERKLVSAVGRVDFALVTVRDGRADPLAIGGASALSSATRADGFVLVPADLEGYPAGAAVTVWRYDA